MIVAITGGSGFIGRHLIAAHLARGDQVRYLTRAEPRRELEGAIHFRGGLHSPAADLENFVAGADVLYHCAAELRDEAFMKATNVNGTANLLAAANRRIKRWVQLSSTGVYGAPRHKMIDESSPIAPATIYEQTKALADDLVLKAASEQNHECVLIRPSNVYGIDMVNQSLFQMIRMIEKGLFFYIGKPGAVANYIHVDNVVDALMRCGSHPLPANGRTYIVSDYCSLESFTEYIAAALKQNSIRFRVPEPVARLLAGLGKPVSGFPLTTSRIDALTNKTVYNFDRISSELGYKNNISMEKGITQLTKHWLSHAFVRAPR